MVRATILGGLCLWLFTTITPWQRSCAAGAEYEEAQSSIDSPSLLWANGTRASAPLRDLRSVEGISVELDGALKEVRTSDLIAWGKRVDVRTRGVFVLADGSWLATDEPARFQRQMAEGAVWPSDGIWTISDWNRAALRAVFATLPIDRVVGDRELLAASFDDLSQESLELRNGDHLDGRWLEMVQPVDDEMNPRLRWRSRLGTLEVAWERIRVLRLGSKSQKTRQVRLIVGMQDGSQLRITDVRREGDGIDLELACGIHVKAKAEEFLAEVASLEFLTPNAHYLSDVEPLSYRHVPYLSRSWPLGRDRSASGTSLRSRGAMVSKGIGMHSTSRVAFDLSEGYARFEACVVLDDSAGKNGSVVFRVFLDAGDGTWAAAYESPVVRGGDAALPISIDVSKAERMALIVESADRGDLSDHANWLYARLIKP